MQDTQGTPLIIAHRGAPREAPENTAASFAKALQYAIDGIELDVQMSADGALVLYHDDWLTKFGRGQERICDLPWSTLRELEAGAWFGPQFAGEPLMRFDDVLEMLAGRTRLLIEIKSRDVRAPDDPHDRLLMQKALAALDDPSYRAHREDLAVLCFNPFLLWQGYNLRPDLKWVLNFERWSPKDYLPLAGLAPDFLWAVCGDIDHLEASTVDWARQRQLQIFAYTCNTSPQVDKALQFGLDALISDRPEWLCARFKPNF